MTKTQYAGQWFQVEMKRSQRFDKIVLDTTWALWDSPEKYAVSVSNDGANWGAANRDWGQPIGNHDHYLSGSDRPLYQDHTNRDECDLSLVNL